MELPAEAVRGLENSAATLGVAKALGGASFPLSAFHDDRDFAVFHFATARLRRPFMLALEASYCRCPKDGERRVIEIPDGN